MNQQRLHTGLQSDTRPSQIYSYAEDAVPLRALRAKNRAKSWQYGYNEKYDMVVISRDGTVGEIYDIITSQVDPTRTLRVALPAVDEDDLICRHRKKSEQYWERDPEPKAISRISTVFQWNEMPGDFQSEWEPYIDREFKRRDGGVFFMNNGVPTYLPGAHYMYLQWSKIDVGYPDFREANRIFFIFWEACKADSRCYGIDYVKIRRSGFSFMASSECNNIATLSRDARIGILSKTGTDAKKMFIHKVVPIFNNYPFFFKPIQDGMTKPKTELSFRVPASRITKKSLKEYMEDEEWEGLDTTIDWRNTDNNAYDGEKTKLLVSDESKKWLKPNNILENHRVTKTCCRLGSKIVGKIMSGSTVNARSKGGEEGKKMYDNSNVKDRSKNNQTKSGLYGLFIPMEWNMEGFIDRYGWPVQITPEVPVLGVDGEYIEIGAIEYWQNEVDSKASDPDALNEHYRQFPRTESHAFRDESKMSLFNLTKIYQQIDYNDAIITEHHLTRGKFLWENGVRDTRVIWVPDRKGRFLLSWIPPKRIQNRVLKKGDRFFPLNGDLGSFGCDSYDISGTVGGEGSNAALSGMTKFNMDPDVPSMNFFCEYIARPPTREICFEEMLMCLVFFGMPVLVENNKPGFLYYLKNRGYRPFSINRPDKHNSKLSVAEREIGGIPNTSEAVKLAHAAAIESYIEKYVGYDMEGINRPADQIGEMLFNRTLMDWAGFDITSRTRYDASISSGLAIMANQKHLYTPEVKQSKISVSLTQYSNRGMRSRMIQSEYE